jgi:hypothetical protein
MHGTCIKIMATIIFDHRTLEDIPLWAQASCTQRPLSKIYPRSILAFIKGVERRVRE